MPKMIEREKRFIKKQDLLAKHRQLLDEYIKFAFSFNFTKANEIRSEIVRLEREIESM
jgi:hypothetical protein